MAASEQQVNYQTVLNNYFQSCPEGLLGVLVFEGDKLEASSSSLLPASLVGFPPPAKPQKIHARRVNEQPCLVFSDSLPDKKLVCLIFPAHIRLSALRSQAAKTVEELTALSLPKTGNLTAQEEAVLAEFIQAAASSKYARDPENHTQPVRVNQSQTQPVAAQASTQALYWPTWYQVF